MWKTFLLITELMLTSIANFISHLTEIIDTTTILVRNFKDIHWTVKQLNTVLLFYFLRLFKNNIILQNK